MTILKHRGYCAGHPWYYFLGGDIPTIKAIRVCAISSDYEGYLAEGIHHLSKRPEPRRSHDLKAMRCKIEADLRDDIGQYRQCAMELRVHRRTANGAENKGCCEDIHTLYQFEIQSYLQRIRESKDPRKPARTTA